jgi:hypothetical protein
MHFLEHKVEKKLVGWKNSSSGLPLIFSECLFTWSADKFLSAKGITL